MYLILSSQTSLQVEGGGNENLRLRTLQNTRNNNQTYLVDISLITCSGARTTSHDSPDKTFQKRLIQDKVLSDERTTAYVTTIQDINKNWLECKECNWYKSKQTILLVRLSIQIILF